MDQPVIFNIPQLSHEGIQKAQQISQALTTCLKTVQGVIGDSPDFHLVTAKLEEVWLYANKALVMTGKNRIAA